MLSIHDMAVRNINDHFDFQLNTTVIPFIDHIMGILEATPLDEMIRMRSGVSDLCSKLWEM